MAGDTITRMSGRLNSTGTDQAGMDKPREFQLIETPTVGTPTDLPGFLNMTVRSFGGGWLSDKTNPQAGDGTPAVIDQLGPPPVMATGLNTEGILVKVTGKVVGYGNSGDGKVMWCWIDDGSGTVSSVSGANDNPPNTQMTGIKCVRLYSEWELWPRSPEDIGRPVAITGLCTNRYVSGIGRIRMLHVRCGYGGMGIDQLDWLDD
ncbi:MAG: hypothetical protein ACP5R5_07235, partial [Armatimonadota bacterium]